jgi:hypothetical protein
LNLIEQPHVLDGDGLGRQMSWPVRFAYR